MATCRKAGFSPDVRHLARSILTQLAMVTAGLGITLAPNTAVRQASAIPLRPLSTAADLVELSLVSRDTATEPLVEHFLVVASGRPEAAHHSTT